MTQKNKKTPEKAMLEYLRGINKRPKPFEFYTAADLWTDAHTSDRMLAFHLDEFGDISSRNAKFIDRSAAWIVTRFKVCNGTRIVDFGCGPGLYCTRLGRQGASVTGVDFSSRSIAYAEETAALERLDISYRNVNYLEFETEAHFDLIMMIMCDFCALNPSQRRHLLDKFRKILSPDGSILLDVYSLAAYDRREEVTVHGENLLDGFWSPNPYYGFLNTYKYDTEKVVLDKYTIIDEDRVRTVYNWLQYFSFEELKREFAACGLAVESLHSNVAGDPYDPMAAEFAVIAGKM